MSKQHIEGSNATGFVKPPLSPPLRTSLTERGELPTSVELPISTSEDKRRHTDARQPLDALLVGLVIIGAGLRLCQYIANTSLWGDEILLASNILHRSTRDLLRSPLANGQVAPKGFLLAEKLVALLLGPSDYALRLFPLLCSLAALVIFWRLVRHFLEGYAAPVGLALFATAPPFVTFAAEAKQYSADVAAAVLLLWLSVGLAGANISLRRALWAGAAGAISVWFSQPAVFMTCGLGVSLALIAWRERSNRGSRKLFVFIPMLVMWAISAAAAVFDGLANMSAPTRKFMHLFWAQGLLPQPAWHALQMHWPWNQLKALMGSGGQAGLAYPQPGFYLLLAGFGLWCLWSRLGAVAVLPLAPIGVTLAAAVARQYPFSDRLILFLVPSILMGIATSVGWIQQRVASWSKWSGWVVCVALVGPAIYPTIATPPPYRIEDIKPVMSYLRVNRRPGDAVFLYAGAVLPFRFYSRDYGFHEDDYTEGKCHRGDSRGDLEELDSFRGSKRLWVVITHALPFYHEREDILQYLDTIGVCRDALIVQSRVVSHWALPAEVWLFDLSDPRRPGAATAASISLLGDSSHYPRKDCDEDAPLFVLPRTF